ncbi:SRPBCC family protein [Variovorax humicola]|uniref:SRPBCC family protein n=1 Tax=Variovorax humicola TaxID=1769758 RepID=A0ABU8W5R1_9BURK
MASIHREMSLAADAAQVWDAVRDVGALHTRLVPGFVVECRMDGNDARIVKFGNGIEAREVIVDLDDDARRLVWSATGERLSHHNASFQVFDEGAGRCKVVWIADLLPNAMAPAIAGMIDAGMRAMKARLEAA